MSGSGSSATKCTVFTIPLVLGSGYSELFLGKHLPVAAGNEVDESGETEPKPSNENTRLEDAERLSRAQGSCRVERVATFSVSSLRQATPFTNIVIVDKYKLITSA